MSEHDPIIEALRKALRRLPGPVALITARANDGGAPAGMIASAVIPVSMAPPSMLVAVNQSASMHRVICGSGLFCINLLTTEQAGFVDLFLDRERREQRFGGDEWSYDEGMPWLPQAASSIFCRVEQTLIFGTHELFIGVVEQVRSASGSEPSPLGWMEGTFAQLGPLN